MPLIPGPQFVSSAVRAGRELGYDERTTDYTVDTTTPGGDVIVCAEHIFPGTPVMAEFQACGIQTGTADFVVVTLYEGASYVGIFGTIFAGTPGTIIRAPFRGSLRITPTAGPHTYTVKAYKSVNDGAIQGGPLGGGSASPIYIQFNEIVLA